MKRTFLALALLSVSLIAYQIVLMSVLSLIQWHHFASMVIALALLGFGAGGTFLTLTRSWCLRVSDTLVPSLMILSGLTMPVAVLLSQQEAIRFDVFRLFFDARDIVPLVLTYLLFFVPFFFGALAIGIVFTKHTERIGQLYFFNLLGSGIGAVVAILSASVFAPDRLPTMMALLPTAGGAVLGTRSHHRRTILLGSLSVVLLSAGLFVSPPSLIPSEYKSLTKTLLLPDARIVTERSSPRGLIQVVSSPALRSAPGLSLRYRGAIPPQHAVFLNGNWIGSLSPTPPEDSLHLFNHTTLVLPYLLAKKNHALILDAGTGMRASQAFVNGVDSLTVVESDSDLLDLLKGELAALNDSLLHDPRVRLVPVDSRTFLLGDPSTYDMISLPLLESFGGTSGLFALEEQFLLTREAFQDLWDHLSEEGVLSVSTWMDYPPRSSLRVLSTLTELLRENGLPITQHLVAIKSWGTITFAISRSPITDDEARLIREYCQRLSFDPLLLPDLDPSERDRFNVVTDTFFTRAIDALLREDGRFLADYPFHIQPSTDQKPYFSQFLRWDRLSQALALVGEADLPFLELGSLLLLLTAAQVMLLACLLILLPLTALRAPSARWKTFLYFSSLGLGFLFVEIILIQQFTFFWGHPVFGATSSIGAMLVFSGIGSWYSTRISSGTHAVRFIGAAIVLLLLVYAFLLNPGLKLTIALPFSLKLVLMILTVAPPAFFMGMMFPLGLRQLHASTPSDVPWAWGINGTMSVVGGALSVVLLVEFGSSVVILLSSACYCAAIVASGLRR